MNRKKHRHEFFIPQYHTSCPTSRQIHRYADKDLSAHMDLIFSRVLQSPCLVSARFIFPPQLPKAQKEEAVILLMLLSLSLLLMFRIPFNLEDFLAKQTGGNLVLSQSATLCISETTNHIASLNNRNNRGLDVKYDEHRCKRISSQLLAAKLLTLKSTRCTTF